MRKALIVALGLLFFMPIITPAIAQLNQFQGNWVNADPNTSGITRIEISGDAASLQVHAWGSCTPEDCDWGTVNGAAYAANVSVDVTSSAEAVTAIYDSGFSQTMLTMRSSGADQIQVESFTRFTDGSGRTNYHSFHTFNREVIAGGGAGGVAPERFLLYFNDAYLIYVPGDSTLQIAAQGNVLSYGGDWQVAQVQPYLYHMRQNFWSDFYWKINTSRREAYRVTGGSFGALGGSEELLNMVVEPVDNPESPTRFFLRFNDAYLVFVPEGGTLQIAAQNNVLSYGGDWQSVQMQHDLYHLRQNIWQDFYWKIDTSRAQAYRVRGGSFGALGGTEEPLSMTVSPVQ